MIFLTKNCDHDNAYVVLNYSLKFNIILYVFNKTMFLNFFETCILIVFLDHMSNIL